MAENVEVISTYVLDSMRVQCRRRGPVRGRARIAQYVVDICDAAADLEVVGWNKASTFKEAGLLFAAAVRKVNDSPCEATCEFCEKSMGTTTLLALVQNPPVCAECKLHEDELRKEAELTAREMAAQNGELF